MKYYKQYLLEMQGSTSWKNILKKPISEDATYTYLEIKDDVMRRMFDELLSKRKQTFNLIKGAQIKRIYDEHKNLGFIKSEKLLNDIIEKLIKSTAQLETNNLLAGHEQYSAYDEYKEQYGDEEDLISKEDFEELADKYVPWDSYSDFGTKWALEIVGRLIDAKTDDDKIILINHLFDVIHQRGDFAEFYVEGGSQTLSQISGSNYGLEESKVKWNKLK